MHQDGVGVRQVQPRLDDGGADQDVRPPLHEVVHDGGQLLLVHAPVPDGHLGLRRQPLDAVGPLVDGADAVVQEEHLPAPVELPQQCLLHHAFAVVAHKGADRLALLRRRVHRGHVADAGQGHREGARNGRGGQREDIHLPPQFLEPLLVDDAEPLLVIDDHEPQLAEVHVLLQHPVRADDDVDDAVPQRLQRCHLLLMRAEAAQHLDAHRVRAEPVGEGRVVLLREDRCWAEHRHLQPVLHSLEGGTHGDLRLAVPHVAADQVVHGVRRLHRLLHGVDGLELIAGLRVGEGVLHLVLPQRVRREGVAGEHLPRGVQRDELTGHLASGALCPLLGPRPFLAA